MGSKDKVFSQISADKGFDDIGMGQPTGTISAIGDSKTAHGRWKGKLLLTIGALSAGVVLKPGMAIRIAGLDSAHNGLTRILAVVSATQIIVNIDYNDSLVDAVGTWALDGGEGAWDSFEPIGSSMDAANMALTFWDQDIQSQDNVLVYDKGRKYVFPGIIKSIQVTTAGNVRLYRSATLRPWGKDAQ